MNLNPKSHYIRDPSGNVVSEIPDHELYAIRNLAKGEATPDQQKKAFRVIVEKIASTDDFSYRPDNMGGDRITNFNEGRRYVGLQVRKLATAPVNLLIEVDHQRKEKVDDGNASENRVKPARRSRANTRKPRA